MCNLAIEYSAILGDQMICVSDAAFADDLAIRYSMKGYLFNLFNRPID